MGWVAPHLKPVHHHQPVNLETEGIFYLISYHSHSYMSTTSRQLNVFLLGFHLPPAIFMLIEIYHLWLMFYYV